MSGRVKVWALPTTVGIPHRRLNLFIWPCDKLRTSPVWRGSSSLCEPNVRAFFNLKVKVLLIVTSRRMRNLSSAFTPSPEGARSSCCAQEWWSKRPSPTWNTEPSRRLGSVLVLSPCVCTAKGPFKSYYLGASISCHLTQVQLDSLRESSLLCTSAGEIWRSSCQIPGWPSFMSCLVLPE